MLQKNNNFYQPNIKIHQNSHQKISTFILITKINPKSNSDMRTGINSKGQERYK